MDTDTIYKPSPIFTNPWYGTKGSRSAKIMIVGEAWGQTEDQKQKCFVGESGQDLDALLGEARIPINDVFFTNVIHERPEDNNMSKFFYTTAEAKAGKMLSTGGLYPRENIIKGLQNLKVQIDAIKPEIIIALGNYALWALTDSSYSIGNAGGYKIPTGIMQWRGSMLYTSGWYGKIKLLPTYHPVAALRTYPWRYMIKHDMSARIPLAFKPGAWEEPSYDFIIRPRLEQVITTLETFIHKLESGKLKLSLDLETHDGLIACCGLAPSAREAICIPFITESSSDPDLSYSSYWSIEEEYQIMLLLRRILLHPNFELIGQNLLYDVQYIVNQYFVLPRVHSDTMLMHHTVWPGGGDPNDPNAAKTQMQGIQKKALYNLSSLYCDHHIFWKDEGKNWRSNKQAEDVWWNYNCKDAVKTFEVDYELKKLVHDFGLDEQYDTQMQVFNDMLLPMMMKGILTNREDRQKVANELARDLELLDQRMAPIVPESVIPVKKGSKPWYRSPTKLKQLFYEVCSVQPVKKPGGGSETTGKDALPIIAQREPILAPVITMLERRRSMSVYHSTFAKMETDPDDRMRCSYNPTGTDTFRLSSSENIEGRGGNLQNIPSDKEDDGYEYPNMRRAFIPDPGYELGEFDLGGADAQVVAWEAKDEDLKTAFRAGLKLHIKNCRDLYPERTRDMTDEELKALDHAGGLYHNAKRRVHGTNYGGTPRTFVAKLRTSLAEEEEFHERWFHLHPGIKEWHNRTNRQLNGLQCWRCDTLTAGARICPKCGAITGRTVGNKFGYRIVYFDRPHELFTKALAWKPQSTVAINTNKGALAIRKHCPWVELLLQVHDSLICQWPIRYSDRIGEIKQALHTVTVPYADPLTIPWGLKLSRKSWGDAEQQKW